MNLLLAFILGLVASISGATAINNLSSEPEQLGANPFTLQSNQLAPSPQADYILSTDGTDNAWIVNSGGGGGSTLHVDGGGYVYPQTGDYHSAPKYVATSTTQASTFVLASSTHLTVTGNLWANLTGNADTATALAANGANCSAGNAPLGVDASGAVESCFDVWTETENTAAAYIALTDLSETIIGIEYNNTTGVFSTSTGYTIPLLASTTEWATAFGWGDHSTQGYLTGNETITLSGDVSGSGATAITTTIGADKILESMLKSVNSAVDEDILTYESTTGDFEWHTPSELSLATSLDTAYNGGASITADSGAVAITVPDTSNNAGLTINQNDVTNDPYIAQFVNSGGFSPGVQIQVDTEFSEAILEIFNNFQVTGSNDMGGVEFYSLNSVPEKHKVGELTYYVSDNTDGSEDSVFKVVTDLAGSLSTRFAVGDGINGAGVGNYSAAGVLESNGDQDLILQTGNSTTGNITITDGASGDITISPNGTGNTVIGGAHLVPDANDGGQLGISGTAWSDLFLASGSVINWNASDLTLTHASNLLTLAGGGLDLGGADSFELPNGTNPTVDATGEIAYDATTGQPVIYNGSSVDTLFTEIPRSLGRIGSTSYDYALNTFSSATTTWSLGTLKENSTYTGIKMYTDIGTCLVRIGDGGATTTALSASTTANLNLFASNNAFTTTDKPVLEIGSCASTPNFVDITLFMIETRQ